MSELYALLDVVVRLREAISDFDGRLATDRREVSEQIRKFYRMFDSSPSAKAVKTYFPTIVNQVEARVKEAEKYIEVTSS